MVEAKTKEVYKNTGFKSMHLSIAFFLLVLIGTIGLYFYNNYLSDQNTKLETKISQVENSIEEKQKDKLVQVYDLYTKNKNVIDRMEKQSRITKYINHLEQVSTKYDVKLTGFDYNNGELMVDASTTSDLEDKNTQDVKLNYQKTVDFIKLYRSGDNPFELGFINNFKNSEDKQKFSLSFILK